MVATSHVDDSQFGRYRWFVLIMAALTACLVVTLPNLSLPPMFTIISEELNLSLVEVGTVWGMGPFAGIFFALIAGSLGDRFGSKISIVTICLFTGIFGLLRSTATDFISLTITTLLFGVFQSTMSVILFKIIRQWFPAHQLGTASGVISAGYASGLMLGPLLSTSVILPLFGSWRQVLIAYGIISIGFALLWIVIHPKPNKDVTRRQPPVPLMQSLRHVSRLKMLWVLALAGLGISGCFSGFTGYLPTYLKDIGWAELDADRALSVFFLASLIAVVPLSMLADRFQWRRGFLIIGSLILAAGISAVGLLDGPVLLIVLALTGLIFDGFMAIYNASALEVEGIGMAYAGSAIGFTNMIRNVGGTLAPPVGNSLAAYGPGVPFLLWGGMAFFGTLLYIFVYRTAASQQPAVNVAPVGD